MAYMGVSRSNLTRMFEDEEEEEEARRAYYARVGRKKRGPWSSALAADKNLAQRKRQWQGWLNQRQGTGGRISPRHETHHEVRPSDINPNIQPGGKSDKWALTPSGGSGIRQTLRGDPSAFTGGAYKAALAKNARRHSGVGTRPQRRHAAKRAAYQEFANQQRAQLEDENARRMAAPHMGQAMANQLAARALGNQGQPMGQPMGGVMGGVMGQGPAGAWNQHPANTGVAIGQPAGDPHWDHRREMTEKRKAGADARRQEALIQAGRTRDKPFGFQPAGLSMQAPVPYGNLEEDFIELMYG